MTPFTSLVAIYLVLPGQAPPQPLARIHAQYASEAECKAAERLLIVDDGTPEDVTVKYKHGCVPLTDGEPS